MCLIIENDVIAQSAAVAVGIVGMENDGFVRHVEYERKVVAKCKGGCGREVGDNLICRTCEEALLRAHAAYMAAETEEEEPDDN